MKKTRYFDYSMLAVLIFLVCFGLVMLYSTSSYSSLVNYGDSMYYFKRQVGFYALGFTGMWIVYAIDYHFYIKWAKYLYFLSLFLMALVQTPLGKDGKGRQKMAQAPAGAAAAAFGDNKDRRDLIYPCRNH